MSVIEKRITDIIKDLTPEDKARLFIEDGIRDKPTLSPQDQRQILGAMSREEGQRYNAFTAKYNILKAIIKHFRSLAEYIKSDLYSRDIVLYYIRALTEVNDLLTLNNLVRDNPNIKPRKPVILKTLFADIHIGSNKKREINTKVKLHPETHDMLIIAIQRIRQRCGALKALYSCIEQVSKALKIEFWLGFCKLLINEFATWDGLVLGKDSIICQSPMHKAMLSNAAEDTPEDTLHMFNRDAPIPPEAGKMVFPVKADYALIWDEIVEDTATVKQIKADPENWSLSSIASIREALNNRYPGAKDPGNEVLKDMMEAARSSISKAKVELFPAARGSKK